MDRGLLQKIKAQLVALRWGKKGKSQMLEAAKVGGGMEVVELKRGKGQTRGQPIPHSQPLAPWRRVFLLAEAGAGGE